MKKVLVGFISMLIMFAMTLSSFAYTEGYIGYRVDNGSIAITQYYGKEKELEIPSMIAGKPVNTIDTGALTSKYLKKVYLPDTVITIKEGAIGENVEVIYNYNLSKEDSENKKEKVTSNKSNELTTFSTTKVTQKVNDIENQTTVEKSTIHNEKSTSIINTSRHSKENTTDKTVSNRQMTSTYGNQSITQIESTTSDEKLGNTIAIVSEQFTSEQSELNGNNSHYSNNSNENNNDFSEYRYETFPGMDNSNVEEFEIDDETTTHENTNIKINEANKSRGITVIIVACVLIISSIIIVLFKKKKR